MSETSNNNFNPNKHLSNVIAPEKPASFGGTPEKHDKTPNRRKFSVRSIVAAGSLATTLFIGVGVGAALSNNGEKPSEATSTSEPADEDNIVTGEDIEQTDPEVVANPDVENPEVIDEAPSPEVVLSPEKLATMSPEEITAAATISVESVTVDGVIDQNLYAKKLVEIINAWRVSGTSESELLEGRETSGGIYESAMGEKYDDPFLDGFVAPFYDIPDWRDYHNGILNSALIADIIDKKPYALNTEYVSSAPIEGVFQNGIFQIDIETRVTDNRIETGIAEYFHETQDAELGVNKDIAITFRVAAQIIDGKVQVIDLKSL